MDDDKQEVLERLRQGLRDYKDKNSPDSGYSSCDYTDGLTVPTLTSIDLSDLNCSLTWPSAPSLYPNANVNMTYAGTNTNANALGTIDTITIGSPLWPDTNGKLSLQGKQADIEINGQSLMSMIQGIQDRLNMLCPDPSMEAEWDELRALREQYEAKLTECREKSRAWKILQDIPPVND